MSHKITAILVDDHAVVRAGFRMLLSTGDKIEVIGEALRGEQAIQLYQELKPDIVVMDLSMPGIGGLETIRSIIQRDSEALILVFSVHHEQVYVSRALNAGAKGYITKNSAPEILTEAIVTILLGDCYVEHGLVKSSYEQQNPNDYQATLAEFYPANSMYLHYLLRDSRSQKLLINSVWGKRPSPITPRKSRKSFRLIPLRSLLILQSI
jgi:two-component system invasion response regulator UvrY